ncbi:NYN domain-containing protein [Fictibacillus sp. Mic-4]|uniref:NYN domain-containing protein n=1 Tax=Fictibacillus TaxID=1329200 RepID=UPI000411DEBA|nr:NYN domain-containing protein [Fictibacillus gelatini]
MNTVLIVDGYNVIGAWEELRHLKEIDFAKARDVLIDKMAEYQAYTGYRVIVVFDAHMMPGIEKKSKDYRVEVIFTRENETADERIEKLTLELKNINTRIYVATSDYAEQRAIFGSGALRKSSRELKTEVNQVEKKIQVKVKDTKKKKSLASIPIPDELVEIFEKWRRGKT